jgi:hypothetical protein
VTIDPRRVVAALLLAAACATQANGFKGGLSDREVDALPSDVKRSYAVFANKCSRCHTLARPLRAQITDVQHWRHYVARMRHQEGSGISSADADEILIFLKYLAEQKARDKSTTSTSTSSGGEP